MSVTSTPRSESDVAAFVRTCAAGILGGAAVGAVVVGILSRAVMRILGAANPQVRGALTDDGEEVGFVTLAGSLNLLAFGVTAGAVAGLVYLWVTRVLPESLRSRSLLFGLLCGSVGGAAFVHDYSSFDYSRLEPRWFSIISFVMLPTMFGLAVPIVVERLRGPTSFVQTAPLAVLVAVGIVPLAVEPGALVVAAPLGLAALIRFVPVLRRAWTSRAVTIAGVAVFVVIVVLTSAILVTHVASVAAEETADCSLLCLP